MRRNLRLTLVLLLLYVVYMLFYYNGTWTLQNNPPYSVSELTDHFSMFVPTKVQTRSAIDILAANADIIQVRQEHRLKIERNSNIPLPSNREVHPGINDRTKSRKHPKILQHPKFEKWEMKWDGPKTLNARIKIRRRYATEVHSTSREEKNISKAEIYKNIKYHPNYMTLPNHPEGSGLNNSRDVDSPNTGKITEHKVRKSVGTLFNVPSLTKTKAIPTGNGDQNKVHAQLESRLTKFEIRSMSTAQVQTGIENIRNTSTHASGIRVIIVAHGRSGSSFFGGIFNAHPDFFFIYEPLNQLKSIVERNTDDYLYAAEYVISSLLKCNFKDDAFLQKLSRQGHHRASCRPLVSPPFCRTTYDRTINFVGEQNWKLCEEKISASVLNKICRKHVNIASKILLECIEPADLTWILDISGSYPVPMPSPGLRPTKRSLDNTGYEGGAVYVLYLVRDPRAMISSRYRLGWVVPHERHKYGLESGEAEEAVKKVCDTMEVNLGAVLLYPQHIKLIRYEELASNPEAIVKRLFRELRISPSKNVFKWIYNKTHGTVKMHAVSLSRNATVSINAWREKIPNKLLEIIEMRCERVMKYLGYLPTHGSQELLRDLRKPLYLDKIKNLKESYQSPVI